MDTHAVAWMALEEIYVKILMHVIRILAQTMEFVLVCLKESIPAAAIWDFMVQNVNLKTFVFHLRVFMVEDVQPVLSLKNIPASALHHFMAPIVS